MYKHKITTLKNGLRLITIPMPQVESMTVMVGIGAGSRYETKRVSGLSHFIEHMAFKGTKKRPSPLKIASEIDAVGGRFNAATGKEFTGYYIRASRKHIELSFDVLADMLNNSLFKPDEIEKEKGVIIEEINMYHDNPPQKIWLDFIRLLYGNNSMGWDVGGEKEVIKKIKREDFFKYIERLYFPKNMVVSVSGKFSESQVNKLVKQYFSQMKGKSKKQTKKLKLYQKASKVKLSYKKTKQAHFNLGVPGFWYSHPDRFVIGILNAILGVGSSSRLFIEIREKYGLAYDAHSVVDFFTDSGLIAARLGVKLEKITEAIKICLNEFHKIKNKKVSESELTKAKEMIKGRMVLSLENSGRVAGRYAALAILEKEVRTPEETMKLIDEVTAEDIQRVAKGVFEPEKLNLAVIGPYKDEKRFRKLLQ